MNRIKPLRLEHDMSQRDLAEKIGCSQKSVDYWEKGSSEPTAGFICALADCFSCSTDYLLGREDDFGLVRIAGELTAGEKQLLELYAALPEERRKELIRFAGFLRGQYKTE